MIRFLEENGYDVSYIARAPTSTAERDRCCSTTRSSCPAATTSTGPAQQRANVKAARDAGVNLAFFSGNEMFWKTRWGPSIDGSNTPYRTLVTYKETHFNAPTDPQDPPTWTGAWADPRFSPPADGGQPAERAHRPGVRRSTPAAATSRSPSQYGKLRFWRNTAVAKLASGQTADARAGPTRSATSGTSTPTTASGRPGEFDLSSTTAQRRCSRSPTTAAPRRPTAPPPTTSRCTARRAARWCSAPGTVQWAWGLDDTNAWDAAIPGGRPDRTCSRRRSTCSPTWARSRTTLMPGLVPATASTDTTPPTSTITSPTAGAHLSRRQRRSRSRAPRPTPAAAWSPGVEVSTDGGTTWHPATMTGQADTTVSWTYSWIAHG